MGRKLKGLFSLVGLEDIKFGVYEGQWNSDLSALEIQSEWQMLENDLAGLISKSELSELKEQDQISQEKGSRIIYVPTFYAWGKVSK